MMKKPAQRERRQRRATDMSNAITYQLDACARAAALEAMLVSDENGLCLAATGARDACEELAAELPIIGRKTREFEGVLLAAGGGRRVTVQRFHVGPDELYLCAVGGDERRIPAQMARSISGLSRILMA